MVLHLSRVLRITTWNVKGLGHPIKRRKVMSKLRTEKCDIVFLQETHLLQKEADKLIGGWVGKVYYNEGTSNIRGVIILINKQLQFKCTKQMKDREGRILVLLGEMMGQNIMLVNVYAPNRDDPAFFCNSGGYAICSWEFQYCVRWGSKFSV